MASLTRWPPEPGSYGLSPKAEKSLRVALRGMTVLGAPGRLTGFDALQDTPNASDGPGVPAEALLGGLGALLVPALVALLGRWNGWLPRTPARLLRVQPSLPPRADPRTASPERTPAGVDRVRPVSARRARACPSWRRPRCAGALPRPA
jgi:hypothetical protein